ncbi:hypothetical protein HanXRQr2_Chr12g0539871 [Helianthus annuus]|uniref:Uncharacterized protein n=1 Tax=Helianthus annuus TaxID=4232 RepID=A0A251UGN6_HELAN|nr:hypothetical protein HanXRQr2_Chr12g0539871 [Helianthus annuus]KAJ0489282.1 hypothetical protein HanHA300_Chr12g0442221 [Helianthus annuus]KAJ0505162.1 hypothetical protein HanHA89_Chr12g0467341 [Helianthus annuus]KAJ0674846.1 hypothetical protein HanLR1_Chr12g0444461 [Helianthus annuus]KAJ0862564.1 hypothetical protein HanPSC8_Chr12g0519651 [Helianthus annuus]
MLNIIRVMKMRFNGGFASFLAIVFALALISSMMIVVQARVEAAPPPAKHDHSKGGCWKCWDDKKHKTKAVPSSRASGNKKRLG